VAGVGLGQRTPLFVRGQGRSPFCLTRAVSPEKAPGRVGNFYPHSGPDSVFLVGNRGRYRVSGSKGAAPAYCHRADGRGACRPRLGDPVPSIELVLGGARRRTPTPRPLPHFAGGLASRNAFWIRIVTISALCPPSAPMPPGRKPAYQAGRRRPSRIHSASALSCPTVRDGGNGPEIGSAMSSERGLVGSGVGPATEALGPPSSVVGTGSPVGPPPGYSTLHAP
jgi:hypothetical protein